MINVLVTSVGGIGGNVAIKCLRQWKEVRIVGVDTSPLNAGFFLADKSYIVPKTGSKGYQDSIMKVCDSERIDVILPSREQDIIHFSENHRTYSEISKIVVSSEETINSCVDKRKTYEIFKDVLPCPETFEHSELADWDESFPIFAKPGFRRDEDVPYILRDLTNKSDVKNFEREMGSRIKNFVFQRKLFKPEHTIDTLCNEDGELIISIPRERLQTKAGTCVKAKMVCDENLENYAEIIAGKLRFNGPFCFQTMVDEKGVHRLIEINPRIGGAMTFPMMSGANIVLAAVKIAIGEDIKPTDMEYTHDIVVARYWEDVVLPKR